MKVALIGAELEENLGLRYIASSLEKELNDVKIIPFNTFYDISKVISTVLDFSPEIVGLSMVFTSRAREFCKLSMELRNAGFRGHIIGGGSFAAFNASNLLSNFKSFNSIGYTEGEEIMCDLTKSLNDLSKVPGIYYRDRNNQIIKTKCRPGGEDINLLPFPKRTSFHSYYGHPIASILSSRGCWRNCLFCSINAWYEHNGKTKFRLRSIDNFVSELKQLYFEYNVRIFNIQDDNFFLPSLEKSLKRFIELRDKIQKAGITNIAIAVKARPDSIREDLISVLHDLGLFRVFLGVENASEHGLRNLNRKCSIDQIQSALDILNRNDIHVAYNLLMFEPDSTLEDIKINLDFFETHIDNPQNFCRAEAHAGTGLEAKLIREGLIKGDYFGIDYRIKDPYVEVFHKIANYAFLNRNFSDNGLHYFNMQVDFSYQLLRRLYPELLNQTIRSYARNFIKRTNLDTYHFLSNIYDFVVNLNSIDAFEVQKFAATMRKKVDENSSRLRREGESIIELFDTVYSERNAKVKQFQKKYFYDSVVTPDSNENSVDVQQPNRVSLQEILSINTPIPFKEMENMLNAKK